MPNIQLNHGDHHAVDKKYPVCFLVHDSSVPENIGSLFRIADALGIEKIHLSGTSLVPPNSKIRRTSRAAEKYVPFSYVENPLDIIKKLKSDGYTIVSLEITSSSMDLGDLSLKETEKVCLVLGSEKYGVCQGLLNESDFTVHIPMMGKNSSMNVATACSIAAYEITRKYNV